MSNVGVPEAECGRCGGVGTPERGAGDLPEAAVVKGQRGVRLPAFGNDRHERESFAEFLGVVSRSCSALGHEGHASVLLLGMVWMCLSLLCSGATQAASWWFLPATK